MIARSTPPSREDVLMDFAASGDAVDEGRLATFVERHPEHEEELRELAEELTAARWQAEPDCSAVDDATGRSALGRFAAIEAGLRSVGASTGRGADDPFRRYDARGLRQVARAFGCNVLFIGRLKDRTVREGDMSAGFLAALAGALGSSVDALAAFLAGPPLIPADARFKSDGAPSVMGKQGLAEALATSGLSDEQMRRLASL